MVTWIEAESEINGVGSLGILKATSGNATKRLKTRAITRAGKSAQAIIMKQIATEERQAEKGQMKEWKENIMQEVAREVEVYQADTLCSDGSSKIEFSTGVRTYDAPHSWMILIHG